MSHRFRGEALFALERFEESIMAFRHAEQLGGQGTEEVFFWRALAHANCGRFEKAEAILREFIRSPNAAHHMVEKCNDAIQHFKKTY
ncbi:hypothetical protein IGB42_03373 [Andreprevotia sp. IGB-42]|nr:hypothetical protein IGB42_03373 [Andreprevotia sp. IGB-42]